MSGAARYCPMCAENPIVQGVSGILLTPDTARDCLPLTPCGRRWREAPDEGFFPRAPMRETLGERPLTRLCFAKPPTPARGEGETRTLCAERDPSPAALRASTSPTRGEV